MSKEKANERINSQISSPEKKKRNGIIIAIVVIVILVLLGVILYLLLGKDADAEKEPTTVNMIVTPENIDETLAQMAESEKTSIGSFEVNMTNDWEFDNGSAVSSNASVKNSTANRNTVYFTIARSDDGSVIYKSPYLPIGSSVENIKLDTPLDAGTYDTVLTYHLVDEENKEVSTLSVALTIIIKN